MKTTVLFALSLLPFSLFADDVVLDGNSSFTAPGDYPFTWTIDGSLTVGRTADAHTSLVHTDGLIQDDTTVLGDLAGSEGSLFITGEFTVFNNRHATMIVGNAGNGVLTLADQASLNVPGELIIANQAGSVGTVNIGAYDLSAATLSGALQVDAVRFGDGEGVLNFNHSDGINLFTPISGGGRVVQRGTGVTTLSGANTYAGGTSVQQGTLNVYGSIAHAGADLQIGDVAGGSASLAIVAGGHVTNANGNIGVDGGTGVASVSGIGSQWTSGGTLAVGLSGVGTLEITNGAHVSAASVVVGSQSGSVGGTVVSGAGSLLEGGDSLVIGSDGAGMLSIRDGATVSAGNGLGGPGTLSLSLWGAGANTLDIGSSDLAHPTAGGTLLAAGVSLGSTESAVNFNQTDTITFSPAISGAGAVFQRGTGETILTGANTYGGATTISGGSLTVNGGTISHVDSNLTIGDGTTFTIKNAGAATARYSEIAAGGSATVTGTGSTWTSVEFHVGLAGPASAGVQVLAGGGVLGGAGMIGMDAGSAGFGLVSGAGSSWKTNYLAVGGAGAGTFEVKSGGIVEASGGLDVGSDAGSQGTLTIAGTGSKVTVSSGLKIGASGEGTLTIENGGALAFDTATIGQLTGSSGDFTLAGAGSVAEGTGELIVGGAGTADVKVIEGAHLTVGSRLSIGTVAADSRVTVTGPGSKLYVGTELYVGYAAPAMLVVDDGEVSAASGVFGFQSNAVGSALINGAAARLTFSDRLTIGGNSAGTLTLQNGGSVRANGAGIHVGTLGGSPGTIHIGSPDLTAPTSAGVIDDQPVMLDHPLSTVTFNQANDIEFTSSIVGVGGILQRGPGTTLLARTNLYTGPTIVAAGTLGFSMRTSLYGSDFTTWTPENLTVAAGATAAFRVSGPFGFNTADLDRLKVLGNGVGGFLAGASFGIETTTGDSFTYSSIIRDSNSEVDALGFVKLGEGTLTLAGANTYTGGTVVRAGTLVPGNAQALGAGQVVVAGGTLQLPSGIAIPNHIVLAGGHLSQQLGAGSGLATLGDFTGDVSGGVITTARLVGGDTSAPATIQTAFALSSPAANDDTRQSGVFTLSGIPVVDLATGATDTFVLQLAIPNVTANSFLAWFDPATTSWVNAVEGNHGGVNFFSGIGAYDPATDFHLGTWGVDVAGGAVWAVLNHNSDFAITLTAVPESREFAAGLVALLGLVIALRRRPGIRPTSR